MRSRVSVRLLALLTTVLLLGAACEDPAEEATEEPVEEEVEEPVDEEVDESADDAAEEPEDDQAHNEADIEFLHMMVPHHDEAVEMAEMVFDRTDRDELLELADDIIAEQEAEIEVLREWQEDWSD